MSTSTTYSVTGMTCGHCAASVKEEIGRIDGVTGVEIDLVQGGTSAVRVTSEAPLALQDVREAVAEAGYTLTGATT